MKKIVLPLFALVIIMSACVKTPEPIRFSILGDSYSSYEGYVHPDSNDVYPYHNIGLTGVEQMWWAQVADSTGWILERNNSFSGALMCNYDYVDYYGKPMEIFDFVWSFMKGLDRESYFKAVDKYCSFCETFIPKRSERIIEKLKTLI